MISDGLARMLEVWLVWEVSAEITPLAPSSSRLAWVFSHGNLSEPKSK